MTTVTTLAIPEISGSTTLEEGALAYAAAGWYVIPVDASKNPGSLLGKGWHEKSSRDPEVIRGWLTSDRVHALALHVGRSGAVAFDVDNPAELAGPLAAELNGRYTGPFQSTRDNLPGRGHYLYALPEGFMPGNSNGGLGRAWGDVRGRNGVIIVEPSVHEKDHGRYHWERTGELAELPDDLRVLLPDAGTSAVAVSPKLVEEFIGRYDGGVQSEMSAAVHERFQLRVREGGSRHNAAVDCACQLAREAVEGMYAAGPAFDRLEDLFTAATRSESRPASEWPDILAWAIGQAEGAVADDDDRPLVVLREARDDRPVLMVSGTRHAAAALHHAPDGWGIVRMEEDAVWSETDLLWAEERKIIVLFHGDYSASRGVHDAATGLKEALEAEGASDVLFARLAGARAKDGLEDVLDRRPEERRTGYIERVAGLASKRLGRAPARKPESSFFNEKGSLKATTTADAVLDGQPAAIARGSMIALYRDGAFRVDRGREPLYAMLVKLLGEDYRPNWRSTIEETLLGILHERGLVLPEHVEEPVLNCRNGMLDLRTGELTEHDPRFLSAIQVPVNWDPDARCPRYEDWMGITVPDQADHLEEVASTMLDPSRTPQKAAFLFGPSRSGKSTFLRIMAAIAGDGNLSAVSLHQLADNKFMSAGIYQKMLNVSADLSSAHVKDTSLFKMMIGEDVIEADRKYGHTFRFTNQALFAFSANEIPTVSETSRAYIERIAAFRFGTSFAGREDPAIEAAMMDELPGVLTRWVGAWQRFRDRGLYLPTDPDVANEFETKSDRVARWTDTRCTVFPDATGTTVGPDQGDTLTNLYNQFKQWVREDGPTDAMSRPKFAERLRSIRGVGEVYLRHRGRNVGLNVVTHTGEDRVTVYSGTKVDVPSDSGSEKLEKCVGRVAREASSTYVREEKMMIKEKERDSQSTVEDVKQATRPTHDPFTCAGVPETPPRSQESHESDLRTGTDSRSGVSRLTPVPGVQSPPPSGDHPRGAGNQPGGSNPPGDDSLSPVQAVSTTVDPFSDPLWDPFAEPGEPATPAPSAPGRPRYAPWTGSVGFDLETADAGEAFTYGPGFVRICGVINEAGETRTDLTPGELVEQIEVADAVYGHNIAGFDGPALAYWHGLDWEMFAAKMVDTEIRARLADPPRGRQTGHTLDHYDLDHTAAKFGLPGKTDDVKALKRRHGGYDKIPLDDPDYHAYLVGDLVASKGVHEVFQPQLSEYEAREHRLASLAGRMTLNGFKVNEPLLRERIREGEERKAAALKELAERFGIPVTRSVGRGRGKARVFTQEPVKSPLATTEGKAALIAAVQEATGQAHYPRTPTTGDIAAGQEGMAKIKSLFGDRPDVADLCDLVTTVTTIRTVYQTAANFLAPDGRVHPKVSMRQSSGRWSVVEPGMTVFGKHNGRHVERAIFDESDDGLVIITCDMSQVDMRAIAGHCQDPAYMALFEPGRDAHTEIGNMVGVPRQDAKAIGHGWNYGLGGKKMIADGKDPAVVWAFINGMEEQFPILMQWREGIRDQGSRGELLDNGFGRMMRCEPAHAYTVAPALMGQGGARDLMCSALLRLPDSMRPYLRTMVHDEIVMAVPERLAEEIKGEVKERFETTWRGVPILADTTGPCQDWGAASAK